MVTGKPPFLAETLEQIRTAVLKKSPISPSLLNSTVPEWLEKIIVDCLAKEPEERIQSANDFLGRLNKATKSIGISSNATIPIIEDKINLSPQQKEIIKSAADKILVLGGAGTGKTTTLIYKVFSNIKDKQFEPDSLLIATFTKKAAEDIKTRLEKLLARDVKDMWLGTLHTICYRILKKDAPRLDFGEDFEIVEDSLKILRTLSPKLGFQKLRLVKHKIEYWKNHLIPPQLAKKNSENEWDKTCAVVYQEYQQSLKDSNLMDFDDLIYYTAKLLENSDLLKEYTAKFSWVLVDELQDLNPAQYNIIQLLSSYHNRVFLTGDEDQSIYEWRGAHPEYVFEATKDYPDIKTYALTQNFRVPEGIWRLANNLISKNKNHKPKPIILLKEKIENVELFSGDNEIDEVYLLSKNIKRLIEKENKTYSDFAILYRLNSQSRSYEEGLAKEKIPYSIIGAERFYERDEVKYLVDFLKAVQKKDLNMAISPITWLLGTKPDLIKFKAGKLQIKTNLQKVLRLVDTVNLIFADEIKLPVTELLELILEQSEFTKRFKKDNYVSSQNRLQNIQELQAAAKNFAPNELDLFLNHLAVLENLDLVDWGKNTVKLMTIHSAKGLEFPVVFLSGMVEGIFPLLKNLNSPKTLAEERRLCFVALTRTLERLFISYPKRFRYRSTDPSRFIAEMLGM